MVTLRILLVRFSKQVTSPSPILPTDTSNQFSSMASTVTPTLVVSEVTVPLTTLVLNEDTANGSGSMGLAGTFITLEDGSVISKVYW